MTVKSIWLLFIFFHLQKPYFSSEFFRALWLLLFAWNKAKCWFSNQNVNYVHSYSTIYLEWRRSHSDFFQEKTHFSNRTLVNKSAFTFFIDDFNNREILSCTETKALRKLKNTLGRHPEKKSTSLLEYLLLEVSLPKGSQSMVYCPKFGDLRFSNRPWSKVDVNNCWISSGSMPDLFNKVQVTGLH